MYSFTITKNTIIFVTQYYIIIKYLFKIIKKENKIPNNLDKRIDDKLIELQNFKEKKSKNLNRDDVRHILIKEYIDFLQINTIMNKISHYVYI